MTLVISRFDSENRLFTVTDSRFTYEKEYKFNQPYKHYLILNKNLILTPKINISYAGYRDDALNLIQVFYKRYKHSDFNIPFSEILSLVKYIHEKTNFKTDFLLNFIDENDKASITKVSDGVISTDQPQGWIGDRDAFNKFQYFYLKNDSNDLTDKLFNSMNEVILDVSLETVGGYPILSEVSKTELLDTTTNLKKNFTYFRYFLKAEAHSGFEPQRISGGKAVKLELAKVSDGGYDLSYLVSENINYSAVCVCSMLGKIATIICPQLMGTDCLVYKFETIKSLCDHFKSEYKIELKGVYLDENNSIRAI